VLFQQALILGTPPIFVPLGQTQEAE
jgi:hypothetical protein